MSTLRRDGDYLIYDDEDGMENRCLILMETAEGGSLHFTCASHGQQGERHLVITPNEDYEFVNGRCASADQATTKHYVDLWARETLLRRRRIVIEAPSGCDASRLSALDGVELSRLADEYGCDADWDIEEAEDWEDSSSIDVSGPVPEEIESDIVFKVNEAGDLIEAESGNPAAFVD